MMKAPTNKIVSFRLNVLAFMFVVSFLIFFITSSGETPFNYFTRLADALIHGRLYLIAAPPWLSELIPAGTERWYVPYSPMPAFVAIPFVLLFGVNFPQQLIAHSLAAGSVVLSYLITKKFSTEDSKTPLWTAILTSVGTIMWFEASVGSSWYLGQLTSVFFLFLAIYLSLTKKSFWVGICVAAAYLSRVHVIFSVPLFLFLLKDSKRRIVSFVVALILGIGIGALYNLARFGVPWDKGYLLIPGVLEEPWFAHGIENPIYIPQNLVTAFWSFPILLDHFPYIQPSWNGLAIWITTPAFSFAFAAPIKKRIVQLLWAIMLPIFLFVLAHGSNGFAQFGYRFSIDFYPFLILLTALGVERMGLKKIHWLLLFVGVFVNFWGVLWINKFGWVSF